jgi:Flp pilus assembly protein TadG
MSTGMRNQTKNQQGQAMVEFALVLPLLLVVLLGIVQFGILFHNYETLTDAVRAGARQAAVSRTLGDPQGVTKSRVKQSAAGLDANKLVITVSPWDPVANKAQWTSGGDVSVSATYPWNIKIFGFAVLSGNLKSKTTERVE